MPESAIYISKDNEHALVIPMTKEAFGGFISGLLGRPQTIESSLSGAFDLDKDHIEILFHLVNQRVSQQNRGVLIQFTVAITYTDDSTVLLNSFEDFKSYREIRPQVSIGADLSWTYLIQFEDKEIPEKQVIELAINAQDYGDSLLFFSGPRFRRLRKSFAIRIQHTARTWGSDIEHLLLGQLKAWLTKEHWLKTYIYENPGKVAACVATMLMISGWWATYSVTQGLLSAQIDQLQSMQALPTEQKINEVLRILVARPAESVAVKQLAGYLGTFGASLFIFTLINKLADNPPKKFLVLSDAAKIARTDAQSRRRRGWTYFLFSGLAATVAGVISRYIFARFFQ